MKNHWNIKLLPLSNERNLSIAAFSLFSSWLLAFPFEGQVLYTIAHKYNIVVSTMVLCAIAAHFTGLFISGVFIKNIQTAKRMMFISTVLCIMGSIVFLFHPSAFWTVSLAVVAFSAGFFVASWGFYFKWYTPANERIKTAADVLIYSNILMIVINAAAVYISPYAGLTVSILMLSGALCLVSIQQTNIHHDTKYVPAELSKEINPIKPLFFLFLFIVVITINSGLMYEVINPAFQHHKLLTGWYWAVPYIAALYFVRNLPPKTNRAYILNVAISMIGLAFIFFMILDSSALSYFIINTLMLGAFGVCDLFWWTIIGQMLDYSDNPAKLLGIGLSANVLGVLIGGMIGNSITAQGTQNTHTPVIAIIVIFVILIILPFLNKYLSMVLKSHAFLEKLSGMEVSRQNKTISDFFKSYELTGRESEIAMLLFKGRTYKMIAGELYLSQNTVKTHIRNIYSKLNIQSKTALVKLMAENTNIKNTF